MLILIAQDRSLNLRLSKDCILYIYDSNGPFNTRLMKFLFSIFLLCFSGSCFAQSLDTTVSDINANVRFFEDTRINLLTSRPDNNIHNGKARGYRIQIYNGIDRDKAQAIQSAFIKSHPGVSAYLIYNQPHFRVRIGNFLSRSEASELYQALRKQYTCMIVPTIITINR